MRMSMRYLALLGCLAVLLTGGCAKQEEAARSVPVVKTQRMQAERAADASSYAGQVRGRYESQLSFRVGGKVIARRVEVGSAVAPGDVLLELDPADIEENRRIAAAQVESARAQLKLAEANAERYRQLFEQSAVSAAQYDQYRTAYESSLATLRQAEAQYAQSGNALAYSQLRADEAGVISGLSAEVGQVVAAGQTVATLVQSGALEVETQVPENRLAALRVGDAAEVSFWALEGVRASGTVREIAPYADAATRTYKVRVQLDAPPQELRLGMTASVRLAKGGAEQAYLLPLAAVYQTGDAPQVWVVEGGRTVLRAVQIEAFGDNQVKVTHGLKDGDEVVVAGVHKLRDGQEVRSLEGEVK